MENIVITIVLIGFLYFCMSLLVGFNAFVQLDRYYPRELGKNLISAFIVGLIWPYFLK